MSREFFIKDTNYATEDTAGVVKVGSGLEMKDGVLVATGGTPYIYMTQDEYEALTEYEEDQMYWVTYPVSGGHLVWRNGEIISGDGTLNNYYLNNKIKHYLLKPRIILTENLGYDEGNKVYRAVLSREKVTHVDIASTMTNIDKYCFGTSYLNDKNTYLKEVNINKSVKSIDNSAFVNCTALKSIIIPDSVTTMGSAFKGCYRLETVVIGNGIETIDSNTFTDCTALKTITINKPAGSISGAPWGATNATVVWNG